MQTAFAKYEGAGNDFILIDNREGGFTPRAELIAALCDRHFGIGADGLMTLRRSAGLDCSMRYYNADGSATAPAASRFSPNTGASAGRPSSSMPQTGFTPPASAA